MWEMTTILLAALAAPTVIWLLTYILPQLMCAILPTQNLKKKYGAEWALVTGGGTGIGRAIVEALALQGLNVVIVSLDDNYLKETFSVLQSQFPAQQFRKVGVAFAPGVDYMEAIEESTKDIHVQCVFCNAGYIVTGFFDATEPTKQRANLECNAAAASSVAQHFLAKMIKKRSRGCVVFTSSAAAYIPTPFAIMYGASKAFVSNLAASLAVEVRSKGIDVLAVHPSPVASNFYDKVDHKIELMEGAAKGAVQPSALPQEIFRSLGRVVWRDIGGMAVGVRVGTACLGYNFIATMFAMLGPYLPDYKKNDVGRG
jgi:short-subunit dehydrogenase